MTPTPWTEVTSVGPDWFELKGNQSDSGGLADFIFGCFAWEQPDLTAIPQDWTEVSAPATVHTELTAPAVTWTEVSG